jgi:hypothetical protein
MEPIQEAVLRKLDLGAAFDAELETKRNLLPPEPWIDPIRTKKKATLNWVKSVLEQGRQLTPNVITNARKPGYGIRPVPVVGIAERIAYRALTSACVSDLDLPGRGAEEYRQMLSGPLDYVREAAGNSPFFLNSSDLKYVVESDIVAFYQYVDHELLAREIQLQTGLTTIPNLLSALLTEIEQRKFGIPQLLEPSDQLSELYIRVLERNLIRRGLNVWRYNDDFRIGAKTFGDALEAIERLAEAAREIGLAVNDHKTKTPALFTYLMTHTNLQLDDHEAAIDPQDVELIVVDYLHEDEEQQVAVATATLARIDSIQDRIDLKDISSVDIRDLRRAVNTLARHADPGALPFITQLFFFVPSLTPRASYYLLALHPTNATEVEQIFDRLIVSNNLSDWQKVWLAYVGRTLNLFLLHTSREAWAQEQMRRGQGGLLAAECALALSEAMSVNLNELDRALRTEPEALAPWYVLAIKRRSHNTSDAAQKKIVDAVRGTSPIYRILLDETPPPAATPPAATPPAAATP